MLIFVDPSRVLIIRVNCTFFMNFAWLKLFITLLCQVKFDGKYFGNWVPFYIVKLRSSWTASLETKKKGGGRDMFCLETSTTKLLLSVHLSGMTGKQEYRYASVILLCSMVLMIQHTVRWFISIAFSKDSIYTGCLLINYSHPSSANIASLLYTPHLRGKMQSSCVWTFTSRNFCPAEWWWLCWHKGENE